LKKNINRFIILLVIAMLKKIKDFYNTMCYVLTRKHVAIWWDAEEDIPSQKN